MLSVLPAKICRAVQRPPLTPLCGHGQVGPEGLNNEGGFDPGAFGQGGGFSFSRVRPPFTVLLFPGSKVNVRLHDACSGLRRRQQLLWAMNERHTGLSS